MCHLFDRQSHVRVCGLLQFLVEKRGDFFDILTHQIYGMRDVW